jgi:pimeloyl-ACP methyl ester carboxylesterase
MLFFIRNIFIFLSAILCLDEFYPSQARLKSESKKLFCDSRYLADRPSGSMCIWGDGNALYIYKPKIISNTVPILYLSGGPGIVAGHNKNQLQHLADQTSRLVLSPASYGLYGDTIGSFDCLAADEAALKHKLGSNKRELINREYIPSLTFYEQCAEQLASKKRLLIKYNTINFSNNINGLREKLSITSWVVIAESYGARLAITLAQAEDSSIKALILDSPETPWVDDFWDTSSLFEKAIKNLSKQCSKRKSMCPGRRPGLEHAINQSLEQIVSGYDRDTIVSVTNGSNTFIKLTGNDIIARLFNSLRNPKSARFLPYLAVSKRKSQFLNRFEKTISFRTELDNLLSFGIHHYIRCTELPINKRLDKVTVSKNSYHLNEFVTALTERQMAICVRLGIKPPDSINRLLIPKEIPTLVLTGSLDPVTPFHVVAQAFSKQKNIRYFDYPNLGHVVSVQAKCVIDDIENFIDTAQSYNEVTAQVHSMSNCHKNDLQIKFYNPVSIQ